MAKAALLIMAAGLGSRYKGSVKQIAPMDEQGHILLDYAVYDAVKAGFDKIIVILRWDIAEDFSATVAKRLEKYAPTELCIQDINDIPDGFAVPEGRTKPWGTGHAVLAARELIKEPFLVIGSDDYFGKTSFANAYKFLTEECSEHNQFMSGYTLKNTLSDNGTVTRGICSVDDNNMLTSVEETYKLTRCSDTCAVGERNSEEITVSIDSNVSMNKWGFHPTMVSKISDLFTDFLEKKGGEMTSEFLLPTIVDKLIHGGDISVKMVETDDVWFGLTHSEDYAVVKDALQKMTENGLYPAKW